MRPSRRGLGDLQSTAATLQQLASNAGFSGPDLATAVAIALAESSGNPGKYNPETAARGGTPQGQGSYGLWQIYLKMHPEFAGANLYDPQTNANAAFSIYSRRGGFSDWTTYTEGDYLQYLPQVLALPVFASLFPNSAPSSSSAPLTIDASTGQPIDDSTPTPLFTAPPANPLSSSSTPGMLVGGIALAIGAILLEEVLS
jgi:hypothetical protein